MDWFEDFIEETRQLWHEQKEEISIEGEEEVQRFSETLNEVSNKESGLKGEKVIGHILSKFKYIIGYPQNSETPADVWGIREEKKFVHIALIQVKSTRSEKGNADTLSDNDKQELRKLTKFVLDRLKESTFVPAEIKAKTLVVSNGYTSIRLAPKKKEIIESIYISFWIPQKHEELLKLYKEFIETVHKLNK